MNLDSSRFLVCILVLAKIVLVQIIVPGGIGLGLISRVGSFSFDGMVSYPLFF